MRMAVAQLQCNLCLQADELVASSTLLAPLLEKHLRMKTNDAEVMACGSCSQLLTLWDVFSSTAKTNFYKAHPEMQQNIELINLNAEVSDQKSQDNTPTSSTQETDVCVNQTSNDAEQKPSRQTKSNVCSDLKPDLDVKVKQNDLQVLQNLQDALRTTNPSSLELDMAAKESVQKPKLSSETEGEHQVPCTVDVIPVNFRKYTCRHCDKKFFFSRSLNIHVTAAHSSKSQTEGHMTLCSVCNISVLHKDYFAHFLRRHSYSSNKNFCCISCPKKFTLRTSLVEHFKKHCQLFTCNVCGMILNSVVYLQEHKKNFHENLNLPIKIENQSQADIINPSCSIEVQYDNKMKTPNSCPLKLNNTTQLKDVREANNKFTCNFCTKTFKHKTVLALHIVNHLTVQNNVKNRNTVLVKKVPKSKMNDGSQVKNTRLKCKHCLKVFALKKSLDLHVRTHHLEPELYFPCTGCPKLFSSKMNLKSHMEKYHLTDTGKMLDRNVEKHGLKKSGYNVIKLKCHTCNQTFNKKHGLKIHIAKTHTKPDKKPVISITKENNGTQQTCNICNKPYINQKGLKMHMSKMHKK